MYTWHCELQNSLAPFTEVRQLSLPLIELSASEGCLGHLRGCFPSSFLVQLWLLKSKINQIPSLFTAGFLPPDLSRPTGSDNFIGSDKTNIHTVPMSYQGTPWHSSDPHGTTQLYFIFNGSQVWSEGRSGSPPLPVATSRSGEPRF